LQSRPEISPTPSPINPSFPCLLPTLPIPSRRTAAPSPRSWGRSRRRPTRDQGAASRSSSTCGRQSGGGARGLHLPRLLATSSGRFSRQRPGSGRLGAEAGGAGPLLTIVLLRGLPRSSALPLHGGDLLSRRKACLVFLNVSFVAGAAGSNGLCMCPRNFHLCLPRLHAGLQLSSSEAPMESFSMRKLL
ncbi:unnamed protein product, partial [Urochloa humidicola]